LGFSYWPVIYYKPTSFLAPSNANKFSGIIITAPSSLHVHDHMEAPVLWSQTTVRQQQPPPKR
jgi:hypothetical protein